MLKNIALRIALLTTMWVVPLAAQSEVPIIRTQLGVRYEIPAGWEWTEFGDYRVTIQHLATKSGEKGKESSPNSFAVQELKSSIENFDPSGWGRIDRNERRTFPNGATARWLAAISSLTDYVFKGEMTIGSRVLWV